MGRRVEGRSRAIPDDAATIASATTAAAAPAPTQDGGERDRFARPEVSLSEMREVLLAELLDVPALQIRV